MKEQPPVPCLMDFQKNCSQNCPLFGIACESQQALVEFFGEEDQEEDVVTQLREVINSGDAREVRLFIASYLTLNAEKNQMGQCEQFQETKRKNLGWFTSLS